MVLGYGSLSPNRYALRYQESKVHWLFISLGKLNDKSGGQGRARAITEMIDISIHSALVCRGLKVGFQDSLSLSLFNQRSDKMALLWPPLQISSSRFSFVSKVKRKQVLYWSRASAIIGNVCWPRFIPGVRFLIFLRSPFQSMRLRHQQRHAMTDINYVAIEQRNIYIYIRTTGRVVSVVFGGWNIGLRYCYHMIAAWNICHLPYNSRLVSMLHSVPFGLPRKTLVQVVVVVSPSARQINPGTVTNRPTPAVLSREQQSGIMGDTKMKTLISRRDLRVCCCTHTKKLN